VRGLPAAPVSLVAPLINLDGSTDHLARMRSEFDRAGVDFCQAFGCAAKQMCAG
jgi:hypothetical protein